MNARLIAVFIPVSLGLIFFLVIVSFRLFGKLLPEKEYSACFLSDNAQPGGLRFNYPGSWRVTDQRIDSARIYVRMQGAWYTGGDYMRITFDKYRYDGEIPRAVADSLKREIRRSWDNRMRIGTISETERDTTLFVNAAHYHHASYHFRTSSKILRQTSYLFYSALDTYSVFATKYGMVVIRREGHSYDEGQKKIESTLGIHAHPFNSAEWHSFGEVRSGFEPL